MRCVILALRAITLRSCTYDCTQCYIRNPINVPRADLCYAALANCEKKFPFLNLIEGPPWFPDPLVSEMDQTLPKFADTPQPKMGADGLPELSLEMQRSLQRAFPDMFGPGGSRPPRQISENQHGRPSQHPMPVALALPMPSSILPNSHASQGAPMQEFEVDKPASSPCEYEKARARNMAANKTRLEEMGLGEPMIKGTSKAKVPKKPRSPRAPGQAANRPKRAPTVVRAEPVRSPTRLASRHAPQHTLTMPAVSLAD